MNRKELIKYATDNYSTPPHIAAMLTAIEEACLQMKQAAQKLYARGEIAVAGMNHGNYTVYGSFLPDAGIYEEAAGKLNTLCLTLAIMLQQLGAKIDF